LGKLFGTDGIRGKANQYPLTPEMAVKIGKAMATFFKGNNNSAIVMGRDTRISGDMLMSAVAAGICSTGMDVHDAGVLPTPGVAYLTLKTRAAAGVMISASHNPFYDNGIKVFDSKGLKISDTDEAEIEKWILGAPSPNHDDATDDIGVVSQRIGAVNEYIEFLLDKSNIDLDFNGLKIVLDCANGAASCVAPLVFTKLGAEVISLHETPDGRNINDNCGSEHTDSLAETVVRNQAHAGLAFDGDADRLIAVDETGQRLTGDQVLALCARMMKDQGRLTGNTVVSTVMSNIGLKQALNDMEITHVESDVGDRRVMEKMQATQAVLGGEDSGHTIFLNDHTSGDGILTAMKVLEAMRIRNEPLSVLKRCMTIAPQVLVNVNVNKKPELKTLPSLSKAIEEVENLLGSKGRVLVRYSGTQPICRVMVEGPTPEETRNYARRIAESVRNVIG
jgi:phosphoglucosamine mutase